MTEQTNQTKHVRSQTMSYFIIMVGLGAVMVSFGPVLPRLAAQTQTDLGTIGLLFTSRSIGFLLGSLLGGRIYDRLAGHPLFAGSLLVLAATFAAVPIINVFWLLLLVTLLMGIASGLLIVGCNTLLVWVHPENVGPWMNAMSFFNGSGGFFVPIVITAFITMSGEIDGAFFVLALMIAMLGMAMFFVPSPAIRRTTASTDASGRIRYGMVSLFALVFLLYVGAEMSFSGWLYTYTVTLYPNADETAALLTSAFWAGMSIGRLLAIPIASRLRARTILWIDFAGSLTSMALILIFPFSLAALWAGTIGFGLCMSSLFPTWLTFADRRIKVNGKINGIFFAATALGTMVFPWLSGQLFTSIGPLAIIWVILITLLVATGIFVVMRYKYPRPATGN